MRAAILALILLTGCTAAAAAPSKGPGGLGAPASPWPAGESRSRSVTIVAATPVSTPPSVAAAAPRPTTKPTPKPTARPKAVATPRPKPTPRPAPEQTPVPVQTFTVKATCDRISVNAGGPAWIMIYAAPQGVVTPTEEQERIVDAGAPSGLASADLPGDVSYVYDVSVTYSETVEDVHGTAVC